jgi:hypothetical protein
LFYVALTTLSEMEMEMEMVRHPLPALAYSPCLLIVFLERLRSHERPIPVDVLGAAAS